MDMKRIYCMLEKLTECAEHEVNNGIENLDSEEFGKVTDMIKDLSEALYYREITVAMEESEYGEDYDYQGRKHYDHYRYKNGRFAPKGRGTRRGYDEMMTPEMYREHEYNPEWYRDMDRMSYGRMYYTSSGDMGMSNRGNSSRSYTSEYGKQNESRYDRAKRTYTETKEMHRGNTVEDKQKKMRELENYSKELAEDVTDMIADASQEEKELLKKKLSVLVQKI